jgi:hypothetical protein
MSALKTLARPTGTHSDDLANAAIPAVAKLASAAGHPLKNVPGATGSSGGGGSTTVILIALVLAALATTGALIATRRRRAPA